MIYSVHFSHYLLIINFFFAVRTLRSFAPISKRRYLKMIVAVIVFTHQHSATPLSLHTHAQTYTPTNKHTYTQQTHSRL